MATPARRLEIGTLDGWQWDAACQIRGVLGGRERQSSRKRLAPEVSS